MPAGYHGGGFVERDHAIDHLCATLGFKAAA
jgi:hypothetical protein